MSMRLFPQDRRRQTQRLQLTDIADIPLFQPTRRHLRVTLYCQRIAAGAERLIPAPRCTREVRGAMRNLERLAVPVKYGR